MGYAKKNLRDVEDSAVEHGLSDGQENVESDGEIVSDFWAE